MACFSTAIAPERRNPTAKNRVWDFFRLSNETHPANRRQPLQPRRKNRPTLTKTASGIPYWLSADPIREVGGTNLYAYVGNNGVDRIDVLGLFSLEPMPGDAGLSIEELNRLGAGVAGVFKWMRDNLDFSCSGTGIDNYDRHIVGDPYRDPNLNGNKLGAEVSKLAALPFVVIGPKMPCPAAMNFGVNSAGHLIKHADVFGFSGRTPQELQKVVPELQQAASALLAKMKLTRVGEWNGIQGCKFYVGEGRMIVTRASDEFLTAINKTSNAWFQKATPVP